MSDERSEYARVAEAADFIGARVSRLPQIAVVLGSGLGGFAAGVNGATSIPYGEIPHWPVSSVAGHEGRLVIGAVAGREIAALSGRVHLYEGYDARTVTFSTRVMALLGVTIFILTNAAGGISPRLAPGSLMAIDDHINLMGTSPLIGPDEDRFGPRFPDMTVAYSNRLRALADQAAAALGIELAHGVYAGLHGPSYETPAEVRYLRTIGADAVGMSTIAEAIVARQMSADVLGISCIANMAAGAAPGALDHREVLEIAREAGPRLAALLEGVIARV